MEPLVLIAWAVALGVVTFRRYIGWPTTATLLEYQGGIFYRRGRFVRKVGAGRHWVMLGVEKIMILDQRAIAVSFDQRAVTLSDGATVVFGFSASAQVRDVAKALYCAQNYNEAPAYIFLCCARLVLNGHSSASIVQEAAAKEIISRAKSRLEMLGFDLVTFKFTYLTIASPAPGVSLGSPNMS